MNLLIRKLGYKNYFEDSIKSRYKYFVQISVEVGNAHWYIWTGNR